MLIGTLIEKLRLGSSHLKSDNHDFIGYAEIWQTTQTPPQYYTDIYEEKHFRLTPTFPQDSEGLPFDIEDAIIPTWRMATELTLDLSSQYLLLRHALQHLPR